jgi:hypothetical protein
MRGEPPGRTRRSACRARGARHASAAQDRHPCAVRLGTRPRASWAALDGRGAGAVRQPPIRATHFLWKSSCSPPAHRSSPERSYSKIVRAAKVRQPSAASGERGATKDGAQSAKEVDATAISNERNMDSYSSERNMDSYGHLGCVPRQLSAAEGMPGCIARRAAQVRLVAVALVGLNAARASLCVRPTGGCQTFSRQSCIVWQCLATTSVPATRTTWRWRDKVASPLCRRPAISRNV